MFIDIIVAILLALAVTVVGGRIRARFADADPLSPLARGLRGWRPDGWPAGVQEEDPDRPWGRRSGARGDDPEERTQGPATAPVHGSVRPR